MKYKVGDLIQCNWALSISNDDDTDEESEPYDIFMVIEHDDGKENYEYRIIRQKSLKISYWNASLMKYNFNNV